MLWARSWLEDAPDIGMAGHRAPWLPLLVAAVQAAGFGAGPALRAVGVAVGAALVAATWALGRLVAERAGVMAASPRVLNESARALTDVPAAALLVAPAALGW